MCLVENSYNTVCEIHMDLDFAVGMVHFKNNAFMFLKVYPLAVIRVESNRGRKTNPRMI